MKKIFVLLSIAAALCACEKDESAVSSNAGQTYYMSFEAEMASDETTRAVSIDGLNVTPTLSGLQNK